MNEPNNGNTNQGQQAPSSTNEQSAIPLGQQPPSEGSSDQSPLGQQPQSDQVQGVQGHDQPQEQTEGAIPKAVEAIEKAADIGLEKTSGVVGGAIDKVADAAINALGGDPKNGNNS